MGLLSFLRKNETQKGSEPKGSVKELRSFVSDRIDGFESDVSFLKQKVEQLENQNSEFRETSFETLQMIQQRLDRMEQEFSGFGSEVEREIDSVQQRVESLEAKYEELERELEREVERLDKQKLDGKDAARIQTEENKRIDTSRLSKKEEAKVRILERLKEGKSKGEVRKELEENVCSRQWFYKAWDELEEQAFIDSGEALMHPEDYKKKALNRSEN